MAVDRYGETFAKFYDRYFGDYAEKAAPVLLNFFASKAKAPGRVLDLGCGTGRVALRFLEAGYEVTGLDLSAEMLALAEQRCSRFLLKGKASFLRADMAGFRALGPFDLALSTYNSMNHLSSDANLKACFQSVHSSLERGGIFLFDYHTAKGLREWNYSESADWEDGRIGTSGRFDPAAGKAIMRLKGRYLDTDLDDSITNYTYPVSRLEDWLKGTSFNNVVFTGMEDLGRPLANPEEHKRIVVLAS